MKVSNLEKAAVLIKDLTDLDNISKAMIEPKYGNARNEPRVYRVLYASDQDSRDLVASVSAKAMEDLVKLERARLTAALAEIGVTE